MATANPTKRAVQTPGEEPQATTETAAQGVEGSEVAKDTPQAEPTVAELMEIIRKQSEQMATLNTAVENLSRAQASTTRVVEELPDIASLDKAGIKTPVLTKQGWYVPETFGTNPAQVR